MSLVCHQRAFIAYEVIISYFILFTLNVTYFICSWYSLIAFYIFHTPMSPMSFYTFYAPMTYFNVFIPSSCLMLVYDHNKDLFDLMNLERSRVIWIISTFHTVIPVTLVFCSQLLARKEATHILLSFILLHHISRVLEHRKANLTCLLRHSTVKWSDIDRGCLKHMDVITALDF